MIGMVDGSGATLDAYDSRKRTTSEIKQWYSAPALLGHRTIYKTMPEYIQSHVEDRTFFFTLATIN
jgi:hypothetical protein